MIAGKLKLGWAFGVGLILSSGVWGGSCDAAERPSQPAAESRPMKSPDAKLSPSRFRGWQTQSLNNGLAVVEVAPDIGGRVIRYRVGTHDFLWVNSELAGKMPPASGVSPSGEWLNYGGDKLWPAPQGWDNDEQWPGPPDGILDGSPHRAELVPARGGEAAMRLASREDPRTGIQFIRTVRLLPGRTRVVFDVTMRNVSRKARRWAIWSVTQVNGARAGGSGFNPQLTAWCPLNPKSHFTNGFQVVFGAADNPTFQTSDKHDLLRLDYQYQVGKVALDSSGGWVATVNGADGFVFVQRFKYESGKEYPDGASVEFWSSGLGTIEAWGKTVQMKNDPRDTPYLVECELLSPLARLNPGESYSWQYEWDACNIGGNFPIRGCTSAGVVSEPLKAAATAGDIEVTGRFGVFEPGKAVLIYLDENGRETAGRFHTEVSPLRALRLNTREKPPAGSKWVCLTFQNLRGEAAAEFGRVPLEK